MDSQSASYSILHQPWWWDATAPRGWEQVEVRVDGKLRARWPFIRYRSLGGVTVLGAPRLTNRAGPWVSPAEGKIATQYARAGALLHELIEQLPPFHWFSQNLHPHLDYWLPLFWNGFQIEARVSYVIEDCSDTESLERGLNEATRRQLRKGRRQLGIEEIDAPRFIDVVGKTFRRQGKAMRVRPELLESVIAATAQRGVGRVVGAVDSTGRLHSAALYVWDQRQMYYLLGGGDPNLRSSGAGTLVLWEGLCDAGQRGLTFDFEGSMLAPIERFFRGFGAFQKNYVTVSKGSALMRLARSAAVAIRK